MSHHGAVWRKKVPPIKGERWFREDIKKIHSLVESGELINRIEKVVGSLE
jgi:histidine ammonia-lyase